MLDQSIFRFPLQLSYYMQKRICVVRFCAEGLFIWLSLGSSHSFSFQRER